LYKNENQIEGRNAILEALRNNRDMEKLYIVKGNTEGSIKKIVALAAQNNVVIQEVSRQKLDELSQTKNHQGVIAIASAHNYAEVDDILQYAEQKGEPPFIVILDGITDPHNLGAIIRSAECAGAHGVIVPKHRSVGLNATVAKTSAGAIEYMPVARVTNIPAALDLLKENGVWIFGTDADGADYTEADFRGGTGIVIGSEGNGMGRLVREKCDFLASLPMMGEITSLNASVAAGIFMYEAVRQRRNDIRG